MHEPVAGGSGTLFQPFLLGFERPSCLSHCTHVHARDYSQRRYADLHRLRRVQPEHPRPALHARLDAGEEPWVANAIFKPIGDGDGLTFTAFGVLARGPFPGDLAPLPRTPKLCFHRIYSRRPLE